MSLALHGARGFRGVFVHPFQRKALERFAREHGLDVQFIDDKLSYDENLKYLKSLVPQEVQELAEIYAKTYEEWEENAGLGVFYGVPYGFESEAPLIMLKVYFKISRKWLKIAQNRLSPFRKRFNKISNGYWMIEGQPSEVFNILSQIEDLKPRILRISKKFDVNSQYIPEIGWVLRGA